MPQDVQKVNKLNISNLPDIDPNWVPPTSGMIDDNWVPPDEKKVEEPSLIDAISKHVLQPPEFITNAAKKASDWITTPKLDESPTAAMFKGALGGMTEGAASLLSPANIAMTLAPEGQIANYGARGIGALQGIHGVSELNKGNIAGGLGDIGFGILGGLSGIGRNGPKSVESVKPNNVELPKVNLPNDLLPVGNETIAPKQVFKSPEDKAYDVARNKFGMGKDQPIPELSKSTGRDQNALDYFLINQPEFKDAKLGDIPDLYRLYPEDFPKDYEPGPNLKGQRGSIKFKEITGRIKPDEFRRGSKDEWEVYNSVTDKVHSYWPTEDLAKRASNKLGLERPEMDYRKSPERKQGKLLEPGTPEFKERWKGQEGVLHIPAKQRDPNPTVIDKLVTALTEAAPKREEQEKLYSMERAKRIANAEAVKTSGLPGHYERLSKLSGELPKVDFERTKLSQSDVNDLINTINKSPKLLGYEKINAVTGLLKLLSVKHHELPQRSELRLLGEVFGPKFDQVIEMHGGFGGSIPFKILAEVNGAAKAFNTTLSFAAPMRHGLPLAYRSEYWKALPTMFKAMGSKEFADGAMQAVYDNPNYLLGRKNGLQITDPSKWLDKNEEVFIGKASNLPILVAPFRRAYIGFLNKLRMDTFSSLVDSYKSLGYKDGLASDVAKFINNATGRGSLGRFEKNAVELNAALFSPRMLTSRLTMMNPKYYVDLAPPVRKEALKALLTIASATLLVDGIASNASHLGMSKDAKINTDITNSDFGKARFGNTRIDPSMGFIPDIVAAGRLITGKTTSSTTGKTTILGKGYRAPTRLNVIEDFGMNRASPLGSFAIELLKGSDFAGQPISAQKELLQRFEPILIKDLTDIYKEDPDLLPLGLASAIGMGTQTYKSKPNSGMRLSIR